MDAPGPGRALVVHESWFGNTEVVAGAVATALRARGLHVRTADVDEVDPLDVLVFDLVVLGAPTHAFSLSRASTRTEALRRGAERGQFRVGMREWLDRLPGPTETGSLPRFAVFDTRASRLRHFPAAAGPRAARVLRHAGHEVVGPIGGFCVSDVEGPLVDGELARAAAWIDDVVDRLGTTVAVSSRAEER